MYPEKTIKKKLLPAGASKSTIRDIYVGVSKAEVTRAMHIICVKHNPEVSITTSINKPDLTQKELELLVDRIGTPKGYLAEFE